MRGEGGEYPDSSGAFWDSFMGVSLVGFVGAGDIVLDKDIYRVQQGPGPDSTLQQLSEKHRNEIN